MPAAHHQPPRSRWLAGLAAMWLGLPGAGPLGNAAPTPDPAVTSYNLRLGTQTFAGRYQFTTNTLLVETAHAIRAMGSDVLKFYLGRDYPRQYRIRLASGHGRVPTDTEFAALAVPLLAEGTP